MILEPSKPIVHRFNRETLILVDVSRLYPDTIDIYYQWTAVDFEPVSEPMKLTTWRPENAHKIVAVRCPASHQQVRLGLFTVSEEMPRVLQAPQTSSNLSINVSDHYKLAGVLPVCSAPILIVPGSGKYHMHPPSGGSKSKVNVKKQDEICRIFTSPVHLLSAGQLSAGDAVSATLGGRDSNRRIIITEKTSFDLDKVLQFHSNSTHNVRFLKLCRSC